MSIIAQIKLAWEAAMHIVDRPKSTYKEMVKLDLDEEFMKRLYRIPNTNINTVVRVMWESYNQLVISGDRLLIKHDELKKDIEGSEHRADGLSENIEHLIDERKKIEVERDELLESHSEWQKDYDTAMKEMRKYADKAEDLESALNTSRYFIYLSGMCGFVLGLACLYLVV